MQKFNASSPGKPRSFIFFKYSSKRGLTAFAILSLSSFDKDIILLPNFRVKFFPEFSIASQFFPCLLNPLLIDFFNDLLGIRR